MPKGYLAIVLHAHLPYVRHPEHDRFLEEDWLYEAITETYLPLVHMMERLAEDGVPFRITISLSPSLLCMLTDPLLMDRYERRLESLIELADREIERTRWQPEYNRLALRYHYEFSRARTTFVDRYRRNLITAFRELAEAGHLEIMACGATHGYMPLMNGNHIAQRAQVRIAVDEHLRLLGRKPQGFWLPECAYEPGVDEHLRAAGVRYFLLDTHGILFATPRPRYGVFAPLSCPSGVVAFGRDIESSKQVWSSKEGYPGDYWYREFYRDVGWDLDYDYVQPYLHGDGKRSNIGIKYYRITGPTDYKDVYDPDRAAEKAAEHAGNFMFNRESQIEHLAGVMDQPPIIISPYDAELFGHWWYEGPDFLHYLFRKLAFDQDTVKATTPGEHLDRLPRIQVSTPSISSWGYKGFHEVWLNGSNDWVYRHLHHAADRMVQLAERFSYLGGGEDGLKPLRVRALNQAARELLLAQASDWAFIMKTGTMVEYAQKRTETHIGRFNRLHDDLLGDRLDPDWLGEIESRDNLFPELDFRIYCP
jgi:1,4-alpha-glucan branching enzyme